MENKMTPKSKAAAPLCESCYHYIEDEDSGEYICEIDPGLDEDEYRLYNAYAYKQCPYYQYNDEYISVRKQN